MQSSKLHRIRFRQQNKKKERCESAGCFSNWWSAVLLFFDQLSHAAVFLVSCWVTARTPSLSAAA
nr:MAG TPA: hypothetical protein [Caudoviricetes sp.]